jgi:hypothetical protein
MLKTLFLLLPLAFVSLSAGASPATITIPGSGVSFEAPAEFTPLSKEEIALKWIRTTAPAFAVGNARRTTTIAYDIRNHFVPDDELEIGLKVFERLFDKLVPGIVWKKKEIAIIQGRRWIYLEMTSNAIDTDIHNIILCSPYDGRLVMFNFNSTPEDFPQVEAGLRRAINTLSIANR